MSWIDKAQTDFIITTGDGVQYRPNWLNAIKSIDFNIAEFDFPNLEGTLVYRGKPKGRKFELEIYFQGDDHLDVSESFEKSAKNPKPWQVMHPFYGSIFVQPLGLTFDNTKFNVSKVTGTLIETITDEAPISYTNPHDKIIKDKSVLDGIAAGSFVENVKISANDVNDMSEMHKKSYSVGFRTIGNSDEFQAYFKLFNVASSAINNAAVTPLSAITALQDVLNYPSYFRGTTKSRTNTVIAQFQILRLKLKTIKNKFYEVLGSSHVSNMALSATINADYKNRNEAIEMVENIISTYNLYRDDLESIQGFNPDADVQIALNDLVNYTVSNLFNVALESKQERSFILDKDSNLVLLAYQLYKNDIDNGIEKLIQDNQIGINELLGLRKGRKITYYI